MLGAAGASKSGPTAQPAKKTADSARHEAEKGEKMRRMGHKAAYEAEREDSYRFFLGCVKAEDIIAHPFFNLVILL